MVDGDQREVIEFLSRGESYGRPGEMPQRINTHGSIVFLIGDRVFKLKRAIRFSFLDYSTVTARERFCRAELALNRRTAPALYLNVRALTRAAQGGVAWDGTGPVLDWVVEMRRFEESALFDDLATRGQLTPALMVKLADEIARFHQAADISPAFGGRAGIADVVADNYENLLPGCPPLARHRVDELFAASNSALANVQDLLEARRAEGKVRRCHGDLHLRNICLFEGEPMLFDCIEFSEPIACIDILYDIAFLLMDLDYRGLRPLANTVFNRYLDRMDETAGLAVLPLFLSVRAGVRAKVAVATLPHHPREAAIDADAYLSLALSMLQPAAPRLIAIGGLSGTGKSTVAAGLAPDFAPVPGARIIRSDVLRKIMMKVAPETKLPPSAYTPEISLRVYQMLREQAAITLAAGYTAIVDATFMDQAEREAIAGVARDAHVPFAGLWLAAPEATLLERVASRRGDASDADQKILMQQLRVDIGALTWQRVDASGGTAVSIAAARRALAQFTA